jgi:hypothetical protein
VQSSLEQYDRWTPIDEHILSWLEDALRRNSPVASPAAKHALDVWATASRVFEPSHNNRLDGLHVMDIEW